MLTDKRIDYLYNAKETKQRLEKETQNVRKKEREVEDVRRKLNTAEAAMEHQVNKTIGAARRNLEAMYGKSVDDIQKRIKEEENKRQKSKQAQMARRIDEVNEDLILKNRALDEQLNTLSEKYKVSVKSNSRLYFTLLVPKGARESMIAGGIMFVLTAIVLELIHFLAPQDLTWLFLGAFALLSGIAYAIKGNYMSNNMQYLNDSRQIYDKIAANKRVMEANADRIRNEKNENAYDLESFDRRLYELRQQLETTLKEKDQELVRFDQETAKELEANTRESFREEIEGIRNEIQTGTKDLDRLRESTDHLSKVVVSEYDNQLGDYFKEMKNLDVLIDMMEKEDINTVQEAIDRYHNGE